MSSPQDNTSNNQDRRSRSNSKPSQSQASQSARSKLSLNPTAAPFQLNQGSSAFSPNAQAFSAGSPHQTFSPVGASASAGDVSASFRSMSLSGSAHVPSSPLGRPQQRRGAPGLSRPPQAFAARPAPPPIATGRPSHLNTGNIQFSAGAGGFGSSLYSSGAQSAHPMSMYGVGSSINSPMTAAPLDGVHHIWSDQRPQVTAQESVYPQRAPMSALEAPTSGSYGLFSGLPIQTQLRVAADDRVMSPVRTSDRWNVGTIGRNTPQASSASSYSGSDGGLHSAALSAGGDEQSIFPERPEIGKKGKQIRVRANFFEFITLPGQSIYQYEIKITPDVPPSMNRKIFKELILKYGKEKLGGITAVFDGKKYIYSPIAIDLGESGLFEIDVYLSEENPGLKLKATSESGISMSRESDLNVQKGSSWNLNERKFTIVLKLSSLIDMQDLQNFIHGKASTTPHDALQAIDVLMRHRPSMTLTSVGRSFFTRSDSKLLGDGAECWMGFHQSVRPAKGRLLMNIDVSATAFFEPGPLLSFVVKILGKKSSDDLKSPLRVKEIEKLERLLRAVKIQVNHSGDIKRKYKIIGFTRTSVDMTFFKYNSSRRDNSEPNFAEDSEISVEQYFKKQYNCILKFPYLPCLKVGSPQRIVYLPLEVCDILPGQRYLRKLNESQTAQMIRLTCQTPDRRATKISQAVAELGLDREKTRARDSEANSNPLLDPADADFLGSFGVKVSEEMMVIPARILDPPTLQYHPTSREPLITPREGSWNLREKKVVQPATLHSWAVVCFGTPREMPQHKIDHFLRELINTCKDTGLTITNVHPPAVYGDPSMNVEQTIQVAWQAAGESTQSFPQLILCILPNTGVPLYAEVKRVGDTILGVPTQCVQVKHTFQPKKQYCANVCLKINAKLGGVNSFIVKNPSIPGDVGLPWVSDVPTIIFGADVTHPAHGEAKSSGSVCALVGSLDRLASRYSATVRLQPPRKEVISELSSMVQELLKIFYVENNQIAPQRILFYRDGVSESQFHEVVSAELKSIRHACEKLQSGYNPTITYVVVQKRHHARVFAMNPKDADRSGNIPAGTVIDSHITHPNEYDFYLCSHAGLQGTSRPTHYHVLHDENSFTPDTLQELTNRLCYGYARCTRSVSVVPPAYYADLVAFRAKYHMKGQINGMSQPGSVASREESTPGTPSVYEQVSSYFPGASPQEEKGQGSRDVDGEPQSDILNRRRRKGREQLTKEEEEELRKRLQGKLTPVKPELQKVMYFM